MFEQYQSIKKQYPDALLFFRMGDFYELFFEDAHIASRELQIALTSRSKGGANSAPMCGVPWHAAQSYLAQLVDKGYNVAICEQIEDARASKGLVVRAVSQLITPGTVLDESNLGAKNHNYLGAVFCGLNNSCAFAWADVSTGHWSGLEFKRQADLWQWVRKLSPAELLLVDGQQLPANFNQDGMRVCHQVAVNFELKRATERVLEAQGVKDEAALGLEGKPCLTRACGAIIAYLEQTQQRKPSQLMPFKPLDLGRRMLIDEVTERNLEIFVCLNGRRGKGTLRHVIDLTLTPMGGRFMEDMLRHPWRDLKAIGQIQTCVSYLHGHDEVREKLRAILEKIFDLERLIVRISLNRCGPRDFFSLRESIAALGELVNFLVASDLPPFMARTLEAMDRLEDCSALLQSALVDNLQAVEGEYGLFRKGWNADLDRQMDLMAHGEQLLNDLLAREKARSGIDKLKLGCNRVFGYYFEIGKGSLGLGAPGHFIRRQTLANGERFTTEELKNLEQDIQQAVEKRQTLEREMFESLRLHLAAQKERIIQSADMVAQLDYWQSLAEVGRRENWVMPGLDESTEVHIIAGRHPVVEAVIGKPNFVANDFHLDSQKRLCLLTGPNMAGKSTILRQVALISLLAQMGGMVPATEVRLGIVDRLFSRVGATDNLAQGQSTFMVEMMETARILRQAGKRSLVILDEIGRGTSTYDGMALAWAIAEELAAKIQGQIRTIFATHYHELTALEGVIPGLFTMNVSVGDYGANEILFLHRLLPGPADRSYGVEVARLAGVPYPVVQRARDILKQLEQKRDRDTLTALALPGFEKQASRQESGLLKELARLDFSQLSAESALDILKKWRGKWLPH